MQNDIRRIITEPSANIRKTAREKLAGHWGTLVTGIFLMYVCVDIPVWIFNSFFGRELNISELLSSVSSSIPADASAEAVVKYSPLATLYVILVTGTFVFGIAYMTIMLVRARETRAGDVFAGFGMYAKTLGLYIFMCFFIMLWALIPVAGIVLAVMAQLKYSQSFFILFDHPEMPIRDIVNCSKSMMKGNKAKLFCLELSFIGWALLAALPSGIAGGLTAQFASQAVIDAIEMIFMIPILWVYAYMFTSQAVFYEMLTGKIAAEQYQPGVY